MYTCLAAARTANHDEVEDTTMHDGDGETLDIMPEMNTPSISLEVSETAKDDSAVMVNGHNGQSVDATTPDREINGLKVSESESQPEEEIPVPKPQSEEEIPIPKPQSEEEIPIPKPPSEEETLISKSQSEEEISVSKPQPEDQPITHNSIPEPHSNGNAVPQSHTPKLYSKPVPARPKPIPAARSKPATTKDALLPLRERLAENANKLVEHSEEVSFVPTAEWVRMCERTICHVLELCVCYDISLV